MPKLGSLVVFFLNLKHAREIKKKTPNKPCISIYNHTLLFLYPFQFKLKKKEMTSN